VAQWLFAFDPGGMATFRALALLATHPEQMARARKEIGTARPAKKPHLPFLRACILESLRLWATTPAVLRETTAPVSWERGEMPKHTMIIIFAPYFHRDEEHLSYAHVFRPENWLHGASDEWPLIPFSRGPAVCPARNLVPMLSSGMLAAIIQGHDLVLDPPLGLGRRERLPGTLDNYSLRFAIRLREVQPPVP
jgi:cytochrome P450